LMWVAVVVFVLLFLLDLTQPCTPCLLVQDDDEDENEDDDDEDVNDDDDLDEDDDEDDFLDEKVLSVFV